MIAFQRLSTGPTLPDLISREADRQAQRCLRTLPVEVWLRPATAAVFWQHRNNGVVQRCGSYGDKLGGPAAPRLADGLARVRPRPMDLPPRIGMRVTPGMRLSCPAAVSGQAEGALRFSPFKAGMAACFAGASFVLAAARLLNWCGLLSPAGIGAAMAGADRLTRAGMRLWRASRALRRT